MQHQHPTTQPATGRRGLAPAGPTVPLRSADQRQLDDARERRAAQERLFAKASRKGAKTPTRPIAYERPPFNTPAYWRDCARGWISDEEQRGDQAEYELRRRRALESKHHRAPAPRRHDRPPPRQSKQFARAMATEAARDDRLTPQAKALLLIVVARAGRGRSTDTTKATLGAALSRCPRSIQRYLRELVTFGYVRTQTIKSRRTGYYVGLRVWVMDKVLPFFDRLGDRYDAGKWLRVAPGPGNREETELSLTKGKQLLKGLIGGEKPPWYGGFAYAGRRA